MRKIRVAASMSILAVWLTFSACGTKGQIAESAQSTPIDENIAVNTTEDVIETENKYHVLYSNNVESDFTKYGDIKQEHKEFQNPDGNVYFYYDMDCFYFDSNFPNILNETLQTYYDSVMKSYCQNAEIYIDGSNEEQNTPYNRLLFQYFTYVGDDYISLVYNDVAYMGGAHPYSALDGITIDCNTGEVVLVNRFIDDSDEEIGKQLKDVLGMDVYTSNEWDYYITENSVVFFYYDPRFWDSVATKRVR